MVVLDVLNPENESASPIVIEKEVEETPRKPEMSYRTRLQVINIKGEIVDIEQ